MPIKIDRSLATQIVIATLIFIVSSTFRLSVSAQENTQTIENQQEAFKRSEQAQITSQAVAHYALGNFYERHLMFPLARVELEEAIACCSNFKIAHRDLCMMNFMTGHFSGALAELMITVGLGEPIAYTEAEKIDLNNRAANLHYRQGITFGTKNKWLQAASEFKWALSYVPNNWTFYRSLAFACANTGDFKMAEKFYQTTFELNPNDAFSHADFAFLLSSTGDSSKAEREMSKAVKLSPQAAALHVDLGWMAESQGKLPEAEKEFKEAIQLSPGHSGLWTHLGKILEKQEKKEESIAAYKEALQIDPTETDAKTGLSRLQKG